MEKLKTILVEDVNIYLLIKQRNYLLKNPGEGKVDEIDGLINLLDYMLDQAGEE